MAVREHQQQDISDAPKEGLVPPLGEPCGQPPHPVSPSPSKDGDFVRFTEYEFIDTRELARRLTVPPSWIRDQVRARSEDPLPHVNLGKYVRFLWGSPALELWIRRRIVVGNNRRLGRTQRKEQE